MSFDGTWDLTITSMIGKQEVRLEIVTSEAGVSGTAAMGQDKAPFLEPKLEGDRLQWSMDITKPMKLSLKFDITRDGDTVKGTAKAGFFAAGEVTGVRVTT